MSYHFQIKKRICLCFFVFLCLAFFSAHAQNFPEPMQPPKFVNQFSKLISDDEEQLLENKLRAYHDSTSTQIAIVVLSSANPTEISDYSFKLAEKWGIGQKGKNNGILILIAKDDHAAFIATGYGMEASITDAMAKRIVEENIIANFKNYQYYEGLDEATTIIMQLASGEYKGNDNSNNHDNPFKGKFVFYIIGFILIIIFTSRKGGRRTYYGGSFGSYGGGFGGGSFGGSSGSSFGGFGGGSFGGGGAGGKW